MSSVSVNKLSAKDIQIANDGEGPVEKSIMNEHDTSAPIIDDAYMEKLETMRQQSQALAASIQNKQGYTYTNPIKNLKRQKIKAVGGIRQYKKLQRYRRYVGE